jgi:hypothetical protein
MMPMKLTMPWMMAVKMLPMPVTTAMMQFPMVRKRFEICLAELLGLVLVVITAEGNISR